ncbi:hypothetical protein [Chryseobacterium sp. SL1]|uniref:hypothetical protein n=1 Tax=Chryseobacterium sp. SL1 TaxID=2995159 RepID=UPI002275F3CC|nr:hypothetical protein [Chryseobacterium sp. SL1]MCY1660196.1 hypothetical protein [Chryseobacterium sp. SL1]
MKKIIITSIFLLTIGLKAQVAIGKTTTTNSSCLLEFGTASRGILLPTVSDATTANVSDAGTILFDGNTGAVRFYAGTTPSWSAPIGSGTTGGVLSGADGNTQGVIIGSSTSVTKGILILESSFKAMVLPMVSQPAARFSAPPKGLMVFDTSVNQVAVYNGVKWTYY